MDNQPPFPRDLIIPVLLGGFSVIGIVIVLLIGRSMNAPAEIPMTPSDTPFQYIYLGTEPAITTPLIEGSEIPFPTEAPAVTAPASPTQGSFIPTPTRGSSISTPLILVTATSSGNGLRTNTPTRVSTATRTSTASAANTYDDTDTRLSYSSGWVSETGVNDAYQGTLHISTAADNKSVTIQFAGQEIFFYYQSGASGGTVTIYLDNDPLALTTVNEARDGGVWHYVLENSQTHTIRIEHTSGGSVNIDRFVIPAPTPTPTRTPTATQ
jgi:hypothetical protein